MNPSQYAVLDAWQRFKKTASDAAPESVAMCALEKWASEEAGSPASPRRDMREALAASVAGASLVDEGVRKLAEAGRYTQEEEDFLNLLTAESALTDLNRLTKTAGVLDFIRQHPKMIGGTAGAVIGGGLGAWKDDENRLRGAALGAVPGAVIGALGGHVADGMMQHSSGVRDAARKVEESARLAAQQTAQQATQAAEDLVQKKQRAERWYGDLMASSLANNQPGFGSIISANKDKIIEHAVSNPGKVHPAVLHAAGTDLGQLKGIIRDAEFYHKHGG